MSENQANGRGRGGGRGGGSKPRPDRPPPSRDVQVSKKLSWLLRHGAESEGLQLGEGGFINVQDVLNNRKLRSLKATFEEVRQIVRENDKQRFTMVPVETSAEEAEDAGDEGVGVANGTGQLEVPSENPKDWKIRANQGHSLKVESEGLLKALDGESMPETAVHGTTHGAWVQIVAAGGLKPMGRNHVHFASGLPTGFKSVSEQGEDQVAAPVISGMRKSSTVLVFLDTRKAVEAGLKFWRSDNGVILTEGNQEEVVPVEFFRRVEDRTGEGVLMEDGKVVKDAPKEWVGKGKGRGRG